MHVCTLFSPEYLLVGESCLITLSRIRVPGRWRQVLLNEGKLVHSLSIEVIVMSTRVWLGKNLGHHGWRT